MPKPARTAACSPADARARLETARTYLEIAGKVLAEKGGGGYLSVAAGNAVLAGIAASDAICGIRLGCMHRGEDHRGAEDLLHTATHDGAKLATELGRLLSIKAAAHYGVPIASGRKAAEAIKWAAHLVERATQEAER